MKKTVLRVLLSTICLILALSTMTACDLFGGEKVKKEEIPASAVYEFSTIENLVVEGNEELAASTDVLTLMLEEEHVLYYWNDARIAQAARDEIKCDNGTIYYFGCVPKSDASFLNGSSVYSKYEKVSHTLGTYSGKDVTINESEELNQAYTDAYLTADGFIIHVESTDEEATIKYDMVFKAASAS